MILPRMLDKCRAALAGKAGDYTYACPLDGEFLDFVGIDPGALKAEVSKGRTDSEILAWINAHAAHRRTESEIVAWSAHQELRAPDNVESRGHFQALHAKIAAHRQDIATWFDLLDLDDFVSFGGHA